MSETYLLKYQSISSPLTRWSPSVLDWDGPVLIGFSVMAAWAVGSGSGVGTWERPGPGPNTRPVRLADRLDSERVE